MIQLSHTNLRVSTTIIRYIHNDDSLHDLQSNTHTQSTHYYTDTYRQIICPPSPNPSSLYTNNTFSYSFYRSATWTWLFRQILSLKIPRPMLLSRKEVLLNWPAGLWLFINFICAIKLFHINWMYLSICVCVCLHENLGIFIWMRWPNCFVSHSRLPFLWWHKQIMCYNV